MPYIIVWRLGIPPLFPFFGHSKAPHRFFAQVCVGGMDMTASVHNGITEDAAHRKAKEGLAPGESVLFLNDSVDGRRVNRFTRMVIFHLFSSFNSLFVSDIYSFLVVFCFV